MKVIGTEKLGADEFKTLAAVLDSFIPASTEYGMPSAGEDRIVKDVQQSIRNSLTRLKSTLAKIDDLSFERYDARFNAIEPKQRAELLNAAAATQIPFFRDLQFVVLQCYYRDPHVMESLGMDPRAPYPKGIEVEQGDWELLDEVKKRPKFYRKV